MNVVQPIDKVYARYVHGINIVQAINNVYIRCRHGWPWYKL